VQPVAILAILIGVFIGIVVGLVPGINSGTGLSLLLPIVFTTPPLVGLFLLIALWAADGYGSSISSILINVPGGTGAVATCWDGYPMARQGRAGEAIGISMAASLIAGIIGTIVLMVVAPPIALLAVNIGPAEYTILGVLGLTMVGGLSSEAPLKGLIAAVIGLMTSFVGYDLTTGFVRYNFGSSYLFDGIDLTLTVLGFFAVAALVDAGQEGGMVAELGKMTAGVWVGFKDVLKRPISTLRSSLVGVVLGAMPGIGIALASIVAYNVEKAASKHPEEFGHGAIEGIIGPEASNNSCQPAALIPTLTLGIPAGTTSAIFLAALTMYGISPGFSLFSSGNSLVWALMWGIIISSFAYVVVGLLFADFFAKLTILPMEYIVPVTLAICFVGAHSTTQSYADLVVMVVYGVIGYAMTALKYPLAPAILAVVLGPILERNFFRALIISGGDYGVFISTPVTIVLWTLLFIVLFGSRLWALLNRSKAKSSKPN
jgi:putative tricarboxylic transport membrane protein